MIQAHIKHKYDPCHHVHDAWKFIFTYIYFPMSSRAWFLEVINIQSYIEIVYIMVWLVKNVYKISHNGIELSYQELWYIIHVESSILDDKLLSYL